MYSFAWLDGLMILAIILRCLIYKTWEPVIMGGIGWGAMLAGRLIFQFTPAPQSTGVVMLALGLILFGIVIFFKAVFYKRHTIRVWRDGEEVDRYQIRRD